MKGCGQGLILLSAVCQRYSRPGWRADYAPTFLDASFMSIPALNWAFKQSIGSSAKFILVVLANYADKDTDVAYPSVAQLREMTGLNRKTRLPAESAQ